jgi:hypothetical protein
MNIPSLTDGPFAEDLFPFSLTRSVADIRVGILTIREKWEILLEKQPIIPAGFSIPANIIPDAALIRSIRDGNSSWQSGPVSKLETVIDILRFNNTEIKKDFALITEGRHSEPISGTNKISGTNIFLEPGVVVEHCLLNAVE